MIYTIDQLLNPLPRYTMLSEANTNSRKGTSDVWAHSYGFPLSNQHCLRREGVFILIAAVGKEQESEIPKNVCVFQVLLAGILAM